ncbi:MAG TPA: hypothetical protein VFJ02_24365 [Vicinamibacterales bacterium]|nr:hypothetical protein [Vicinamibacterales bacterium]
MRTTSTAGESLAQVVLLARTFFARFFESDLMPPGLPQVQLVIWSVALLAAPGLYFPVSFALDYTKAVAAHVPLAAAFLAHRQIFITISMTAIGIVALVVWDGMFPDRRDARILSALPVPGSILIGGRLVALTALCAIFLVGVNAIPSIVYGASYGAFGGAASVVHGIAAHFVSTMLAGVFVFGSLMALQGIALNVGGRAAADRVSLLLQIVFVILLLQLAFFFPRIAGMLSDFHDAGWLRLVPSIWFLGLYDVVGGRPAPGAAPLAVAALVATVVVVTVAAAVFVTTHARLTRRALEGGERRGRSHALAQAFAPIARTVRARPVSMATFAFTVRTLARTRNHRLLMAMYVGVGLAFIASAIVPLLLRAGGAGFFEPSIELLSAPFFLSFFTLLGLRVGFAIPVEPKARWVLRLCEPSGRADAIGGVRAVMLLVGVLPSVIVAALTAGVLWSTRAAVIHVIVCGAMGALLSELLLVRLCKLPFACTYYPGTSKIGTLWPLYISGFGNYTLTTAAFEWSLISRFRPMMLLTFVTIVALIIAALALRRRRHLGSVAGFRFEEEDPDAIFAGFALSEGLAAAPMRRLGRDH